MQPGTTTELNLADDFRANRMRFTPVVIEQIEEIRTAFISGRRDAYTNDASSLASFRASRGPTGEQYVLLPETISKEPLGAVVRKGDWRFFDIVRWAHFAMVSTEEFGITSANIDGFMTSANPDIQRLLGRSGEFGRALGVENDRAVKIIRQVGSFGESWERNITPLGINRLWTQGGLLSMGGNEVDTRTATGKLMLTMPGAIAAFERGLMLERQREGIAKARADGRYKGRAPTARRKAGEVHRLKAEGMKPTPIAQRPGIGRASVYRVLEGGGKDLGAD